ncbi:SCP2 sterol-binding domain-containing protein [Moraxella sp. Tifton1]|uniref:SCP2 sterol-binding domain-containing protein n=1 Tax=Moraxella oculi TaxID=2940516 RepID=UPI0020132657|nr:SCP2 sterol-binding domain-containing protein [Moraxella sp. Tifton1]MCL1623598.1 SCP2 sterol-binding domain-containing protein [Moraxella sp. Tifton1]
MAQFLSQAWFDAVEKLNESVDQLNLPPTLIGLVINVTTEQEETPAFLHIKDGKLHQGHAGDAVSTITIDQATLKDIITTGDTNIAIEAFMMGKIHIDGDMSAILSLQSTKPSSEQKALFKEILKLTDW